MIACFMGAKRYDYQGYKGYTVYASEKISKNGDCYYKPLGMFVKDENGNPRFKNLSVSEKVFTSALGGKSIDYWLGKDIDMDINFGSTKITEMKLFDPVD